MPDETTNSGQQPPDVSSAGNPGQQVDYKARFDGQVKKIEQLVIDGRSKDEQLGAKASEIEQLRTQLGIKEAEKTAAIGERDKRLEELLQARESSDKELAELRALRLKVDVATELNDPRLIKILKDIPNMTDKEALKAVLQNLSNFATDAVKEREQQLLSGVTPPLSNGGTQAASPNSEEAWNKYIESHPLGSQERGKAFDDYWSWLEAKHKK